jgi:large subunit ribosomal protein L22
MEARAIQRSARQSARKMRLVIDLIRGRAVPEAYAILRFSKKLAARQIHKVLQSAVANAQQKALRQNEAFDADQLRVKYAVINEGQTLKRFTMAAMGRGTPIKKRTSHVEIHVGSDAPVAPPRGAPATKGAATATAAPKSVKTAARGAKSAKGSKSRKPAKKKAPAKKRSK